MIELKLAPAQNGWLEATWVNVEQFPDTVIAAKSAAFDEDGHEVRAAVPERIEPGQIVRTDVKHVSYHPTQLDLLQADAFLMGTPLTEHEVMLDAWVAAYVPAPEPAPAVPQSVTRAQAKAALIIQGLIGYVQPAIDAIADPLQRALAQNDWDERLTFERNNGMLAAMAEKLGLTDAQIDELFIVAATL